jgi:hypothetical protein
VTHLLHLVFAARPPTHALPAGKCLNPYFYADVLFGVRPTEVKCEDGEEHHHKPEVVLSSSKFYASYDQIVKDDCQ